MESRRFIGLANLPSIKNTPEEVAVSIISGHDCVQKFNHIFSNYVNLLMRTQ